MSSTNSWLGRQRKSDLVEIADHVGLKNYDGLKKSDLEVSLDEYLAENKTKYSTDQKVSGYYQSRAKAAAAGSPVKKESMKDEADKAIKVSKRRATKAADDLTSGTDEPRTASSTALVQTPARSLSLAQRIPLPATPADVANAVDRGTVAVRERVVSMYAESGITEATQATRESLSTVTSVLFCVSAFELFYIRPEVLADRYAFTIPAIAAIGTSDMPVYIPDMFLLLTASFWAPAFVWAMTSGVVPALFGYFFNLSAASQPTGRGRPRSTSPDYVVDPLTFSIVKALMSYVVYAQGVTFGGLLDESSITRLDSAVYGGWKGMLTGCAITALFSVYDAVLKK